MTDHIAVGQVEDDDIVLAAFNGFAALISNLNSAHLRLQVIGCNLGRSNQDTVFAFEGTLFAAVEEEGDVGILLGLGDAQLGQALSCDVLAKDIGQYLGLECNMDIGHGCVILCEADIVRQDHAAFALETCKVGIDQRAGDLSCAVGTEVIENDTVAMLDLGIFNADNRLDELVGDAFGIGSLDGSNGIGILDALALDQCVIGQLDAVPAVVAVHGVETAHDCGDLAGLALDVGGQLTDKVGTRHGRNVAAIQEAMDIALDTGSLAHINQCKQVGDVAVNAAAGQQAVEMYAAAVCLGILDGSDQLAVLLEIAVHDRLGDAGQFLIDNTACADVGMTDLAVAHLALRQTNGHARAFQLGIGASCQQLVHIGCGSRMDRVAAALIAAAVAVEDH